jgi:triacylglycerol lipase
VWDKQKVGKVWRRLGVPYEAIPEMTVEHMQTDFNPKTPNAPGVRYFSFSGAQPAYQIVPPLSSMKIVTSLMEKTAKGHRWGFKDRIQARLLLPKRLRDAVKRGQGPSLQGDDWVKPELLGKNDGIIPSSSAIWGEHLGTLDADHFEQIGWLGTFRAQRFFRGICRMLADAGL